MWNSISSTIQSGISLLDHFLLMNSEEVRPSSSSRREHFTSSQIRIIRDAFGAGLKGGLDAVGGILSQLDSRITALETTASQITQLQERINQLESSTSSVLSSHLSSSDYRIVKELSDKVSELQGQVASCSALPASTPTTSSRAGQSSQSQGESRTRINHVQLDPSTQQPHTAAILNLGCNLHRDRMLSQARKVFSNAGILPSSWHSL